MKLLVIDGNSIINRAFYGIRLLTNKAGVPTNAVLGFLRIYKKLCDLCTPDAAAAAFDLSEPTFRHKQYDAYKAGRRKMPDELAEQLPILKELLQDLGIRVLETPGFEADDILGTLSAACEKSGNDCFLATGDRDALQLVNDHTTVLLASNKETKVYTPQTLFDEYGVTPKEMIEIKALQGDASDNIPGVAGIGQKTALSLIQNYHSIDYIFSHLDTLDVKPGVRTKLQGGEESARMSKHIGTIVTDAPVDTNIETYRLGGGDKKAAAAKFRELELYSLIDTFNLGGEAPPAEETPETPVKTMQFTECTDTNELLNRLQNAGKAWFLPIKANGSVCGFYFVTDESVTRLQSGAAGFDAFCRAFSESGIEKYTYDLKATQHLAIALGCEVQNVRADLMLSAYVLRPTDGGSTLLGYICSSQLAWSIFPNIFETGFFHIAFVLLFLGGVPVVDTLVAMTRRILTHKSPFEPDRGHAHHKLQDAGLPKFAVLIVLGAAHGVFLSCGMRLLGLPVFNFL